MTDALDASILSRVVAAIRHVAFLGDLPISAETRLEDELGLDSLDVAEVVFHIESVFGTEFAPEAIARFRTVADIVTYLSRRFFSDAAALVDLEA